MYNDTTTNDLSSFLFPSKVDGSTNCNNERRGRALHAIATLPRSFDFSIFSLAPSISRSMAMAAFVERAFKGSHMSHWCTMDREKHM